MTGNAHFLPQTHVKRRMSRHALKRAQQRGISQESVKLITAFGEREYDGKGGIRYLMTEKSIQDLRRVVGHTQALDALRGQYAVVSAADQQTVITVAHRYN